MRRVGLAVAGAGALLWIMALLLSPTPTSSHELGEGVSDEGAIDASRVRVSAHAGSVHSYDAANDTTFLYTSVCSHQLCGPLVPVQGDLRGRGLPGPVLLAPVDGTLSLVPVPTPRDEGERHLAFIGPASEEGLAFSSVFEPRSPWPAFLARVGGIALAVAGAGVALRGSWRGALPGLGALASLLVAQETSYVILVQLVGAPTALVALVTALAQWGIRRHGWVAAGIALGAVVAIATSFVALGYFPGDGGD